MSRPKSTRNQCNTTFYRHLKKYSSIVVKCPECGKTMTVMNYYKSHVSNSHNLKIMKECVFCSGHWHWKRGEKYKPENRKHVLQCLDDFVKLNTIQKDVVESEKEICNKILDEIEKVCNCWKFVSTSGEMCGRVKDRSSEYVKFYNFLLGRLKVIIDEKNGIHFDERSGLGKDVYGYIQRFLKGDLNWIHAMVKANAYETFVREMAPIQDHFLVLPFSCLCDGLLSSEGKKCVHRHMIIAYEPESDFEHIWKHKVRMPLPKKGEKSKLCLKIRDVCHLVWTIYYVSRPNSSCDKGIPENLESLSKEETNASTSHFCINRSLHPHSIAFMSMCFENGIRDLLWRQLGKRDVDEWENNVVKIWDEMHNMKFAVPIRLTNWKFKNCVVPLDNKYEPCDEVTDLWLTWYKNKRMYLKINPEWKNMSRNEWYSAQIQKGNTFHCLQDELYVLSPKQQNTMKQIKRFAKRMKLKMDSYWSDRQEKMLIKERDLFSKELDLIKNERDLIAKERDLIAKERDELKIENLKLKCEKGLNKTCTINIIH